MYLLDFLLSLTREGNVINVLNYTYRQCCKTCGSNDASQLETYELQNPPSSDPFIDTASTPLRHAQPPCANDEIVQFKALWGYVLGNISTNLPYDSMSDGMLIDLPHTKL